ncbi:sugar phosphate isomerase/epimerase family protein [uncultured Amnibacterium sp.]|uniref:sugar phosphate isomerase/epimerase family protein n=1 Tax=uncultured Amnibacterium sp. TaxID=1631851 RepID=UPI0035C9480B
MRLAVSNIAWHPAEDEAVFDVLREQGVDAIEIAPTRSFPDPLLVTRDDAHRAAAAFADEGLEVVAFQSMLFGRGDLTIFDSSDLRGRTRQHLERFIDLAGWMGAGRLVFGSPRNRRVPDSMQSAEAFDIATDFFRALGHRASAAGTVFCIEPNPESYDCNFVTTAEQGAQLVHAVDAPGFGLHLDAAGMTLSGDDPAVSIESFGGVLRHFHASAPQLGDLEDTLVDHAAAAAGLRSVGYDGVVSIEMRSRDEGLNADRVRAAIRLARERYAA